MYTVFEHFVVTNLGANLRVTPTGEHGNYRTALEHNFGRPVGFSTACFSTQMLESGMPGERLAAG